MVAIILHACITFGKSVLKDWKAVFISVLSFFAFLFQWNFVLVFVLAAIAGFVLRPKTPPAKGAGSPGPVSFEVKKNEYVIMAILAALICLALILSYLVGPKIANLSLNLSKIGALAFGGGWTALPLIQYVMVDRYQWLSTKEFLDGIALGQVTPGPILITATFVGYKVAYLLGAFMATLGVFSPSFFILVLLIPYHDRLRGVEKVRVMEQGILGSFIGMICLVLYNFGRASLVDIPRILMAAGAFYAISRKVSLSYVLLAGGILSVVLFGSLLSPK